MSSIVPWPSCGGRSSSIYPTNEGAPLISSRRTSGKGWRRKTATFNVRTIVGAAISLTLQLVWKDMGRDLVEEDFAPNIKSWRITDTTLPKERRRQEKEREPGEDLLLRHLHQVLRPSHLHLCHPSLSFCTICSSFNTVGISIHSLWGFLDG